MTGTPITVGRIVHYTLTADDAERINQRRAEHEHAASSRRYDPQDPAYDPAMVPAASGNVSHAGNSAEEGQVYPAMVVRVFDGHAFTANLQVHLDGNDTHWVTSIQEGEQPGTWMWPPRV